jgi:hypothetical protein
MSNYTKSTNFATKDNLTPGDPLKIVRGTEIDTEFNNIATAIATKTDNSAAAITGGSITGITDLAVADGGTGASTAAGGLNNLLPSQTGNSNKYLQTDGTNATWDAISINTGDITGTLPVANGGTGVTSSTGTGNVVLSNSPTLVTPALGTPSGLVGTNISGTAPSLTAGNVTTNANLTGDVTSVGNATTLTNAPVIAKVLTGYVSGAGTVAATDSILQAIQKLNGNDATNANLTGMVTSVGNATTVVTNANLTGAVTSSGNATSLGSFTSAQLLAALTDETGTGSAVFATSPTLVTPNLGTPSAAVLTLATGLPISTGVSGLATGIATFLATPSSANLAAALTDETGTGANVFATSPTLVTPALGTPSALVGTNITGTAANFNINGTVGATTPATGNFTTLTENSVATVIQTDIGTGANEIPLNQYLGKMAYKEVVGMDATLNPAPTIASAATIQPLAPITFISGTTTINTITVPAEFVGGGQITLIPTALWSTGTSGNIAIATTGVVSKALILSYDATTTKWYPSY